MRSLLEVLKLSIDFLKEKGISNYRREAEDLISDALNIDRLQLYLDFDRPLIDEELTLLRSRLQRRGKGEPGAYIHESVDFLGHKIKVSPAVLIPRQETEILIDKIIKSLKNEDLSNKILLDLCCGSGCIGIAIKKAFPSLSVMASDISPEALAVARYNSVQNEADIEFFNGNLLTPFSGVKINYVVCNPPYIAEYEWETLENEVRHYEPMQALVSGKSGLEIYELLARDLKDFLHPKAKVWFEIGATQGEALKTLFQCQPWKNLKLEKDWAGKDRFFFLEIE